MKLRTILVALGCVASIVFLGRRHKKAQKNTFIPAAENGIQLNPLHSQSVLVFPIVKWEDTNPKSQRNFPDDLQKIQLEKLAVQTLIHFQDEFGKDRYNLELINQLMLGLFRRLARKEPFLHDDHQRIFTFAIRKDGIKPVNPHPLDCSEREAP